MSAKFITALYKLQIPENLGRGDKILDGTFLTNDRETIRKIVPSFAPPFIGSLEVEGILNADVVIYADEEIESGLTPANHLKKKMFQLGAFLNYLWLVEDNAINHETSFLFYEREKIPMVDSNFMSNHYTKSDGLEEDTTLSRYVLKKARSFFRQASILEERPFEKSDTKMIGGIPRVSRAFYLAQIARSASDIAFKISNYCSALEALYSTSQSEIAHQLSERVACFLEDKPSKRHEIYRTLKSAYGIRSKIVHGSLLNRKQVSKLTGISRDCDNLVRHSILKIYSHKGAWDAFSSKSETLDGYLLSRIIGADTAAGVN